MSNKKDIVIVGTLSVALFSAFTGYSHFTGSGKAASVPSKTSVSYSTATSRTTSGTSEVALPATLTQNSPESQVAPPAPADTARKKNTRTKAS